MLYMDEGVPAVMRRLGALGLVLQLGWTMAASLIVSLLVGLWLDSTLGTRPWATLVGALVGIAAGTVGVYRIVARVLDEERQD